MKVILKRGAIILLCGLSIAGIYSQTGDTTDDNFLTAQALVRLVYGPHCFAAYHNAGGKYDGQGWYKQ